MIPKFNILSTRTEENLYKDNGLDSLFTELPDYKDYMLDIITLVSLNKETVEQTGYCLAEIEKLKDHKAYQPISSITKKSKFLYAILLIEGLVFLYAIVMLFLFANDKNIIKAHSYNHSGSILSMILSSTITMYLSYSMYTLADEGV